MSHPVLPVIEEQVPTAPLRATPEEAHRRAMERGADCPNCPLVNLKEGPVLGEVRRSKLAMIAEAPGGQEIEKDKVLVGLTGDAAIKGLWKAGWGREEVSLFNVLACRPPGGQDLTHWLAANKRAGKNSPIDCCRPRLMKDLEETDPKVILTMGKYALTEIAHKYEIGVGAEEKKSGKFKRSLGAIQDQAGHPEDLPDGKVLLATLHPSYAMHGNLQHEHVILEEIERACRIADRGHIDFTEPDYILAPDFRIVSEWLERVEGSATPLVCSDIETDSLDHFANIRCIGLGAWLAEGLSILVLPLIFKNGDPYWPPEEHEAIRLWLVRLYRKKKNLFHNGPFDTRILRHHKYRVPEAEKPWSEMWDDTEIGHHVTREQCNPHKLSYVAKRFSEGPLWKVDVDHKTAEDEDESSVPERVLLQLKRLLGDRFDTWVARRRLSDLVLWLYCGKDVLNTMLAWDNGRGQGIGLWIQRDDNELAYDRDMKKAIICRDMGDLGVMVDRRTQAKYSEQLGRAIKRMETKLRAMAGRGSDYNPNSGDQVAELIYDKWGYKPTRYTNTDEPSTGINALIELKNHGVDKRTGDYIELHIVYKSHVKLKSSFVDNPTLYDTEWEWLGALHSTFNVHVVPTGRLSSSGYNMENIPKRAIVNLRKMFVAPPGHLLISSDADQGEARVFAVETNDEHMLEAFHKGLDVHAINASTLFSQKEKDVWPLYHKIVKAKKEGNEKDKLWADQLRLTAKIFCIAEGSPVLVKRQGKVREVAIEKVRKTDLVWDGIEWVKHEGVIYKGEQEVISYQGLTATPDHIVWVEGGRKLALREAVEGRLSLARTAIGRTPIRFMDCDQQGSHPDRQRWPLRTGKFEMVNSYGKYSEPSVEKVRVYDVVNAGPRHRFTVSSILCSNCFSEQYGTEEKSLFEYMATMRDKATGMLMFPGLEEKRVHIWHERYHRYHRNCKPWQERCRSAVRRNERLRTPVLGRWCYFPGGENTPNQAPSRRIQGGLADLIDKAFIGIYEEIGFKRFSPYSGIINQVHDEIVACVPREKALWAAEVFDKHMNMMLGGLPITATAEIQEIWTDHDFRKEMQKAA